MISEPTLSHLRRALGFAAVFLGLITILGTSYYRPELSGTYAVRSDCPGATQEGELSLNLAVRTPVPGGTDASERPAGESTGSSVAEPVSFGFPTNDFKREGKAGPSSFEYFVNKDGSRSCVSGPGFQSDESSTIVFICRGPDNQVECTISLSR